EARQDRQGGQDRQELRAAFDAAVTPETHRGIGGSRAASYSRGFEKGLPGDQGRLSAASSRARGPQKIFWRSWPPWRSWRASGSRPKPYWARFCVRGVGWGGVLEGGMSLVELRVPSRAAKRGPNAAFLPTTRADLDERGIEQLDILIITGDAYVDHPAFGPVLIARFLEGRGYKVGLIAQPDWQKPDDIARMGRPKLFVGVTAGNLDSMLNKLTAQKKMRGEDQYSPNGRTEARPNRASIVYANLCRQA